MQAHDDDEEALQPHAHIDQQRGHPEGAGQVVAPAEGERDRERGQAGDESVVVAAARGVDREHGVPADECDGQGLAGRNGRDRQARGEHPGCREGLVEPRGGVGGRACDSRDRLGEPCEDRAVDRRRVAPVGAEIRRGRALGEGRRRVHVRVASPLRRDPAVAPVGPGVGGEEERRRQRHELDERRDDEGGLHPRRRAPQERQAGQVRDEGAHEEHEERPGGSLVGRPSVAGHERGAVLPGEQRCRTDETGGCEAGDERRAFPHRPAPAGDPLPCALPPFPPAASPVVSVVSVSVVSGVGAT